MKRFIAMLLLVAAMLTVLASFTSKKTDVVAKEEAEAITLDNLDWTIELEGAEKTAYTLADAQAHERSKMVVSMFTRYPVGYTDVNQIEGTIASWLVEGIKLSEFLEDIGATGASGLTWYGHDAYGDEISGTVPGDLLNDKNVMIGWIKNKTETLPNRTKSYVGIFGGSALLDFTSCCSVYKIVIE